MRRPWNIINQPVYSLLTKDSLGNINMNICTYVSAVSMNPKIYMIAIYYNTKTYENLINSDSAVLQLLSKDNISLVRGLGKKSGMKIDKDKYLFSLSDFISNSLLRSGINNVENINIDTVSNESLCFSYRRSFIKKENDYGRMISTIVIKE